MSKLKQYLQEIWNRLTDKQKLPRFHRHQEKFRQLYPQFQIGTCSYGAPRVRHWDKTSTLKIGAYCSIAKNVQIFLGGYHRIDWITSYPFPDFFPEKRYIKDYYTSRGDVVIGSDVWLCENCTILSGVKIGHGAVIASGAVVSRDVAPYAVMAGNPAQQVRWRFDEETRAALLETAWWDWQHEEILQIVDKLCSENISEFLAYARSRNKNSA